MSLVCNIRYVPTKNGPVQPKCVHTTFTVMLAGIPIPGKVYIQPSVCVYEVAAATLSSSSGGALMLYA